MSTPEIVVLLAVCWSTLELVRGLLEIRSREAEGKAAREQRAADREVMRQAGEGCRLLAAAIDRAERARSSRLPVVEIVRRAP